MPKPNLNDIPSHKGHARPATPGELAEIEKLLGKGAWMVADGITYVPVKFVKGVGKVIKVIINKDKPNG